jgi:hypothetical protein
MISGYGEPRLINPDGLTRWWNPVEFLGFAPFGYKPGGLLGTPGGAGVFSATINGYKYFCKGLITDEKMGSFDMVDRGLFPAGGFLNRRYMIDFGDDQSDFMIFNYAIDASWALPAKTPPDVPDDFTISANCPEPFWIEADVLTNELFYLAAAGKGGGRLEMMVTVHDWQGVNTIGEVFLDNAAVFTQPIPCTPQPITDPNMRQYHVDTELTTNISGKHPQDVIICAQVNPAADIATYQQGGMVQFFGPPGARVTAYHRVSVDCDNIPDVDLEDEYEGVVLDPPPFTIQKDFAVIGAPEKEGVYYFGPDYTVYRCPLDYSGPSELYDQLEGFLNFSADQLWEFPVKLARLDMTQAGEYVMFSESTAAGIYNPYLIRDFAYQFDSENDPFGRSPVQGISPGIQTGIMKVVDISATVNFDDTDVVFWIHVDDDAEDSVPHEDVTVPILYYRYPYGPDIIKGDIGAISGSPVPRGTGQGEVFPEYVTDFAVCGLPFTADLGEYDIICGFLEGPPQVELEIFGINCNDPLDTSNEHICTITNFQGLPKDIEMFPAIAGGVDDEWDWIAVLEQGLEHETLLEIYSLDGVKRDTSDIYTGDPISVDVDPYNYKIHIWYYDTTTPGNPVTAEVFGFDLG